MTNPRRQFLQTAIPFFILYCFFVFRTPQRMFSVRSPFWEVARIGLFIVWLLVIFLHLKPDRAWNQKSFIIGLVFGGGWFSLFFALGFLLHWDQPELLPYIAVGIFYGILSGLWSAQSATPRRAALGSFLFFLLQLVADLLVHGPFSYVT